MCTPVTMLDRRYSDPDAVATAWDDTRRTIEAAELFWLTTVRADSRPHVTPVVAVWADDGSSRLGAAAFTILTASRFSRTPSFPRRFLRLPRVRSAIRCTASQQSEIFRAAAPAAVARRSSERRDDRRSSAKFQPDAYGSVFDEQRVGQAR